MPNGRAPNYVTAGALVGIAGLLGLLALQIHGLERRLITQGQQIRALGDATDRLASRPGGHTEGPGAPVAVAEDLPPKHILHPDVPNFLRARDTHWPPPGASLDGVLRRGWPRGDPKGFNPLLENGAEVGELLEQYAVLPLADRDAWTNPDVWHGELASRVEITDDFKEFTIYLKDGYLWNAPGNVDLDAPKHAWMKGEHPVTANDVKFTFDMITNPQVQDGSLKNYYANLESVKVIDDQTLVVRWKKKQYLNISTTIGLGPIPEFLYSHEEDGRPIPKETLGLRFNEFWYNNKGYTGAGPYRMLSYEPGTRIKLVRNDAFRGEKPAIREIDYAIYTDPQQTLLKLKSHEIDLGVLEPGQYREEIKRYEGEATKPAGSPFLDGRIKCELVSKFGYYYIGWNADRPLFADKRVRRAMTMTLDRREIIESVFVGLGQPTTGPYPPDSPYNDPGVKPIPYDLDGARKLLAEAGWQDTDGDGVLDKQLHPGDKTRSPFEFTLLTYGSSKEWGAVANILKDNLIKIGVKMHIDSAEWSLMQKRMEEKSFDAYTGGWATGWETDLYQIWHSSQADIPKGSNMVGFRNKEADVLIEKLRDTFDDGERTKLLRAFHSIVHDEQPYTFVVARTEPVCFWNDVKNVMFAKVRPATNTLPWSVARSAN